MVIKWKNRYYNMKGLSQKVEQYLQKGPCLERLRGIVEFEILGLFGMGVFEVIQNIHTPEGFNNMMSTPLWKGGKCLGEWKDDALPEFGPFETDENKEGMVSWDLHLANFSYVFWPRLLKEKGRGASSSGDGGQGSGGVHPGSASSSGQGEGQAADTHTSWIQFHGTGVHPALTALGGNYLCKSEDKKGKAAQEPTMKSNFETVVGRGVYTSGSWRKAVTYSAPLLYPGQRHLIKFVLLVEVPGDLSDHGVGVAHKAQAIYQEPPKTGKKKKAMMFHMDEGKDSWLIIPKSDYIDALAADAGDLWQPGAGKKLVAWAR